MKDHPPTKSIRDIRTLNSMTGMVETLPHKLHMRLCSLEMERYRRDQERKVALLRATKCEERCKAIEAEVRAIMNTINARMNEDAIAEVKAPRSVRSARGKAPTARGSNMTYLY